MARITIIIINFNAGDLLLKCINSIVATNSDVNVLVVDNNSTDNSHEQIIKNEKIKIIQNPINKGFGYACNQGIKQSDTEYILLLNPDVEVEQDTIKDAITFLDEQTDIAILGALHYNEDHKTKPSCSRFTTPLTILWDIIGLSKVYPKVFHNSSLMIDWDHQNSAYVNQVMGAFLMTRKSVIEKIGLLDDQFFVYYEDMDFCKRAADNGLKVFYNTDIKIFHKGMGTTEAIKDKRLAYSIESRFKYIRKHFSFLSYIFVLLISFLIEPFTRTFFLLIKGKFSEIVAVFKGYTFLIKRILANQ